MDSSQATLVQFSQKGSFLSYPLRKWLTLLLPVSLGAQKPGSRPEAAYSPADSPCPHRHLLLSKRPAISQLPASLVHVLDHFNSCSVPKKLTVEFALFISNPSILSLNPAVCLIMPFANGTEKRSGLMPRCPIGFSARTLQEPSAHHAVALRGRNVQRGRTAPNAEIGIGIGLKQLRDKVLKAFPRKSGFAERKASFQPSYESELDIFGRCLSVSVKSCLSCGFRTHGEANSVSSWVLVKLKWVQSDTPVWSTWP